MNKILRIFANLSNQTKIRLTLLLAAVMIGGGKIFENVNNEPQQTKTEQKKSVKIISYIRDLKLNPNSSDAEWNRRLAAIHPYVIAETILSEGFSSEMYVDRLDNLGYWTIGSGFMLGKENPRTARDKALVKERRELFYRVLGRWPEGTKITSAENQKLMTTMYVRYIYPELRKSFTKPVSADLFVELAIAAYNRGQGVFKEGKDGYPIAKSINTGKSDEKTVNQFPALLKNGNGGLAPKYAVAGHRALGNITDADVLNSLANSVYAVPNNIDLWTAKGQLNKQYADTIADILKGVKDADIVRYFWAGKDKKGRVIKEKRTLKQKKVKEYLSSQQAKVISAGKLFGMGTLKSLCQYKVPRVTNIANVTKTTNVVTAEFKTQHLAAVKDFQNGKYSSAARKFVKMLRAYPGNALVRNDLAATYNKLGRYDDAIGQIHLILKEKNDNSQLGAAYYNAGIAYEQKGNYHRALANYNLALKKGNQRVSSDVARVSKKLDKKPVVKSRQDKYKRGTKKVNSKIKKENARLAVLSRGRGDIR